MLNECNYHLSTFDQNWIQAYLIREITHHAQKMCAMHEFLDLQKRRTNIMAQQISQNKWEFHQKCLSKLHVAHIFMIASTFSFNQPSCFALIEHDHKIFIQNYNMISFIKW